MATSCVRHDPNADAVLPFDDARFDAVVCCVSVDYLVRPNRPPADGHATGSTGLQRSDAHGTRHARCDHPADRPARSQSFPVSMTGVASSRSRPLLRGIEATIPPNESGRRNRQPTHGSASHALATASRRPEPSSAAAHIASWGLVDRGIRNRAATRYGQPHDPLRQRRGQQHFSRGSRTKARRRCE